MFQIVGDNENAFPASDVIRLGLGEFPYKYVGTFVGVTFTSVATDFTFYEIGPHNNLFTIDGYTLVCENINALEPDKRYTVKIRAAWNGSRI